MIDKRISGLVLALVTAMVLPASAMEVHVYVQDAGTTDPIEAAYVQYIFLPGTAVVDTADGYTDINGDLVLYHEVVSSGNDVPSFAVSRPNPNPAGSTTNFDVRGLTKPSWPFRSPGTTSWID